MIDSFPAPPTAAEFPPPPAAATNRSGGSDIVGGAQLRQRRLPNQIANAVSQISVAPAVRARIARVDLFPKAREEFRPTKQTRAGAIVSTFSLSILSLLLTYEFMNFVFGWNAYRTEVSVDMSVSNEVPVNLEITFPRIPCNDLHIDTMDVTGAQEAHSDLSGLFKAPVDHSGRVVASAHGRYLSAGMRRRMQRAQAGLDDDRPVESAPAPQMNPLLMMMGIVLAPPPSPPFYDAKEDPTSPQYCGPCIVDPSTFSATKSHAYDGVLQKRVAEEHRNECCNTCEQVLAIYDRYAVPRPAMSDIEQCVQEHWKRHPGCHIRGTLLLQKVKGNFHFAPGKAMKNMFGQHMHSVSYAEFVRYNVTHTIHHLSIGDPTVERFSASPLSRGKSALSYPKPTSYAPPHDALAFVRYLLQVVPTTYRRSGRHDSIDSSGTFVADNEDWDSTGGSGGGTYEYAVTHHILEFNPMTSMGRMQPCVLFSYDFYPIAIHNVFERPPFGRFLVKLCSILGGVFVVAGLLDRVARVVAERYGLEH